MRAAWWVMLVGCGGAVDPAPVAADAKNDSAQDAATDASFADGAHDVTVVDDAIVEVGSTDTAPMEIAVADGSGCTIDAGKCAPPCEALTANGPWHADKKCWRKESHVFECVSGLDGGAKWTCFTRVSTGEWFLAPSTHTPSGPDYAKGCGDAPSAPDFCE